MPSQSWATTTSPGLPSVDFEPQASLELALAGREGAPHLMLKLACTGAQHDAPSLDMASVGDWRARSPAACTLHTVSAEVPHPVLATMPRPVLLSCRSGVLQRAIPAAFCLVPHGAA